MMATIPTMNWRTARGDNFQTLHTFAGEGIDFEINDAESGAARIGDVQVAGIHAHRGRRRGGADEDGAGDGVAGVAVDVDAVGTAADGIDAAAILVDDEVAGGAAEGNDLTEYGAGGDGGLGAKEACGGKRKGEQGRKSPCLQGQLREHH